MNRRLSPVVRACLTIAVLFLTPSCEDVEVTQEEYDWLIKHLTGTWEVRFASGETTKLEMQARRPMGNFGDGCSMGPGGMSWLSTAFACGMGLPEVAILRGLAKSETKHLSGEVTGSGRLRRRTLLSDEASVTLSLGSRELVGEVDGGGTLSGTVKGADGGEIDSFEARKMP